jgi:nucleotide-binding universal stress UspA family protein
MANKLPPNASNPKPAAILPAKILVSTDFSENALKALAYANNYAEKFGAEVYLVHVMEDAPFISDMKDNPLALSEKQIQQNVRDELEALAAEKFGETVPVRNLVRQGKATEEIVAAAKELNVDLIIISTHGRAGLTRALLGSVAERVVRHAHCPVLVVRQTE